MVNSSLLPIHANGKGVYGDQISNKMARACSASHIFPKVKVEQHYDEVLAALGK
jgi:hypothetical protein